MAETTTPSLTRPGRLARRPAAPAEAWLETVPNTHPEHGCRIRTRDLVRFTCPELTSLCPITGRPDFAHPMIDYVPMERLVDRKSLKLSLGTVRSHGAFHEDCTLVIAKRLAAALVPLRLGIGGSCYPRGASIDVFDQSGAPGRSLATRPGVPPYRARG